VIEAANSAIERKHWTLRREGEGGWQVNGSNGGAAPAPGNAS